MYGHTKHLHYTNPCHLLVFSDPWFYQVKTWDLSYSAKSKIKSQFLTQLWLKSKRQRTPAYTDVSQSTHIHCFSCKSTKPSASLWVDFYSNVRSSSESIWLILSVWQDQCVLRKPNDTNYTDSSLMSTTQSSINLLFNMSCCRDSIITSNYLILLNNYLIYSYISYLSYNFHILQLRYLGKCTYCQLQHKTVN